MRNRKLIQLATAALFLACLGIHGCSHARPGNATDNLEMKIESENFNIATNGLRELFEDKLDSLSTLIHMLDSEEKFHGFCGALTLRSSAQVVADPTRNPPQKQATAKPYTQLREVSFYLLAAIGKDSFYFAGSCSLQGKREQIPAASRALASRLRDRKELTKVDLEAILEQVMAEFELSFQSQSG